LFSFTFYVRSYKRDFVVVINSIISKLKVYVLLEELFFKFSAIAIVSVRDLNLLNYARRVVVLRHCN
jgi:hypothetical protein